VRSAAADDFALLACHVLIDAGFSRAPGNDEAPQASTARAAAELEAVLARSPHMYQARMLLAEVYGALLGAPMLAFECAMGLGLKHIQLDSLFHWRLVDVSGAALGRAVVAETEAAVAANAKMIMESADLLTEAVGKANADGAADVLRLVVRLQRSLGVAQFARPRF